MKHHEKQISPDLLPPDYERINGDVCRMIFFAIIGCAMLWALLILIARGVFQ